MTFQFCSQRCLSCETDSVQVCGEGIDGVTRTISTDRHNVLAILPGASAQSQIGRLFSVVSDFPDITAASNGRTIIITNPSTSGRIMYIDSISGGSVNRTQPDEPVTFEAALAIDIIRNAAAGNIPVVINSLNFAFPDNSAMSVTRVDSLASGSRVSMLTTAFGLFTLDIAGKIIVPPGRSIGVQLRAFNLEPPNTEVVLARITVTWYELDIPTP
jgi:hypothetical protein